METSKTEKYFLFGLLIIILILTLAIFYPFLGVFILAAAFAVIINPVYIWIKKHITYNREGLASFITTILFLLILFIPLFIVGSVVLDQAQNSYKLVSFNSDTQMFISNINSSINSILPQGISFDIGTKMNNLVSLITSNIGNFFTSTFNTLLMTLLVIFSIFYLLKDGEKWKEGLIKILPLSAKNIHEILYNIKNSINRILRGAFIIAIVQGILSWLGLWIFGVPNPALWGMVAGLASFIPTFGTSIIFIPAILFLFFTGMKIEALGLLIWSSLLVGMIDNLLSPYIISKNTEVSSIFILFSILGGLTLMGPIGILIGPLTLSLLYSLVSIYRKEIS